MHRGGGTTEYEGEGLYPSLMRVWNPALSLRTTACPVEDSSARWSNSHALTRDPRGGRHSARNALVLVHERWRRRWRPREHLSWSPDPLRLHRDTVLPLRSQNQRDHRDPIATADTCVCVCMCVPCTQEGSTAADRLLERDGEVACATGISGSRRDRCRCQVSAAWQPVADVSC